MDFMQCIIKYSENSVFLAPSGRLNDHHRVPSFQEGTKGWTIKQNIVENFTIVHIN